MTIRIHEKKCNQRKTNFHLLVNKPLNSAQFWDDGFDKRSRKLTTKYTCSLLFGITSSIVLVLFFTENIYTLRNFYININNQDQRNVNRLIFLAEIDNLAKIEPYSLFGITCRFIHSPPGSCKSVLEMLQAVGRHCCRSPH